MVRTLASPSCTKMHNRGRYRMGSQTANLCAGSCFLASLIIKVDRSEVCYLNKQFNRQCSSIPEVAMHSAADNLYLRVIKSLRTDVLNRTTCAAIVHDWVSKVATHNPLPLRYVTMPAATCVLLFVEMELFCIPGNGTHGNR